MPLEPDASGRPPQQPEFHPNPATERDLVALHRARAEPVPVQRDGIREELRDTLSRWTFNGYPITVQGNNMVVPVAALSPRPDTIAPAPAPRPGPAPEFPPFPFPPFPTPTASPVAPTPAASEPPQPRPGPAPTPTATPAPTPFSIAPEVPHPTPPVSSEIPTARPVVGEPTPAATPLIREPHMGTGLLQPLGHDTLLIRRDDTSDDGRQVLPPTHMDAPTHMPPPQSRHGGDMDHGHDLRLTTPPHKSAKDPTIHKHDPHRAIKPGDLQGFEPTLIPIRIRRADDGRTILAYVNAPTGYVTAGGVPGVERTVVLPDPDSFYDTLTADFAFACLDVSDADGNKVLVKDGEINGEFPTGMGGDDYILTVTVDCDIWAVITYDTGTLEITSRTLDFGAAVPDDEFGTMYVHIAKVWFGTGTPPVLHVRNVQTGDIDFELHYITINGALFLQPLRTFGQPVEVPPL